MKLELSIGKIEVEYEVEVAAIPGYLTTAEAAARLGVTAGRIRQLIRSGAIEASKFGDNWLIPEQALEQFKPTWRRPGWEKGKPRKNRGKS